MGKDYGRQNYIGGGQTELKKEDWNQRVAGKGLRFFSLALSFVAFTGPVLVAVLSITRVAPKMGTLPTFPTFFGGLSALL